MSIFLLSGVFNIHKLEHIKDIDDLYKLIKDYSGEYSNKPLKRILSLIEKEKDKDEIITAIINENYQDNEEWQAEYEKKYKNIFNPSDKGISKFATKIDFFKGKIESITQLPDFDKESNKEKYLGYLILRPLPTQKVCEAMIKTPEGRNPTTYFLTCKSEFSSEINGNKFKIESTPFIQQDGLTGVCAHACLKMALYYLIQQFPTFKDKERKLPTLPEIDEISQEIMLDTPISTHRASGLWIPHIRKVIKEANCNSLIYDFTKQERDGMLFYEYEPDELIYWYMESGFPVIIGFQTEESGHAVVVIGHTFNANAWWPEAKTDYYRKVFPDRPHCLESFAWTNFIIHDDNFGPYLTTPTQFPLVTIIAIPIPEEIEINILPEEAEKIAYSKIEPETFFSKIKITPEDFKEKTIQWIELFWKHFAEGKLVLRTFLMESEKFKENFQRTDGIPSIIKKVYDEIPLPEKIWVTEISIPELFAHKRMRLGEIIIDPTCPTNIYGYDTSILCIHLPGIIGWHHSKTNQKWWQIVSDDSPYQHTFQNS